MKTQMTPEAKAAKAKYQKQHRLMSPEGQRKATEYQRVWRQKNRDKVRQYNIDYWERKAREEEKPS